MGVYDTQNNQFGPVSKEAEDAFQRLLAAPVEPYQAPVSPPAAHGIAKDTIPLKSVSINTGHYLVQTLAEGLPISILVYLLVYYFIQNKLSKSGRIVVFLILWLILSFGLKIWWDSIH